MNSNTSSVLSIVSRIGKLLGALFVIIGFIAIINTATGFVNDQFGLGTAHASTESASPSYGYGSGNYYFDYQIDSIMNGVQQTVSKAEQALNTVNGLVGFMCAGAYVMFIFAIASTIFNILANENIVGSIIDVCVSLVGFIMNFIIADPVNKFKSMSGSDIPGAVIGYIVAVVFLLLTAGLIIRAAFPGDPIITRKKTANTVTYGAGYMPNAGIQGNGYAAPNSGYQNSGYAAPNAGYQNNGYAAPNTSFQNNGYNPNTPNGGRM